MIGNISRLQTFLECRQKDSNLWEKRLIPNRTPTPLLTGSAVHKGLEVFFKTQDTNQALVQLEENYRERIGEQQFVLPEEASIYEREIRFSKLAVEKWAQKYHEYGFQVLYPEVTFVQALPWSEHHCWYMHKLLQQHYPAVMPDYKDCNGALSIEGRSCMMPHYVKGKCDGIVQKQGKIWLLETKTTSLTGAPFFDRWYLDIQPTAYIWGASKALGIRINGFIMNVIKKPHHAFKGSLEDHFAKDPFEREAYLRTDEDLERFEEQAVKTWQDRETAHATNNIYMNTQSCVKYNRRCHYFDMCQRNDGPLDGEFVQKPLDYVEEEYYTLARLPIPPATPKPPMYEEQEL